MLVNTSIVYDQSHLRASIGRRTTLSFLYFPSLHLEAHSLPAATRTLIPKAAPLRFQPTPVGIPQPAPDGSIYADCTVVAQTDADANSSIDRVVTTSYDTRSRIVRIDRDSDVDGFVDEIEHRWYGSFGIDRMVFSRSTETNSYTETIVSYYPVGSVHTTTMHFVRDGRAMIVSQDTYAYTPDGFLWSLLKSFGENARVGHRESYVQGYDGERIGTFVDSNNDGVIDKQVLLFWNDAVVNHLLERRIINNIIMSTLLTPVYGSDLNLREVLYSEPRFGQVVAREEYIYDSGNRLTESRFYYGLDKLEYRTINDYDDHDRLTKKSVFNHEELTDIVVYSNHCHS